MTLFGDVTMRGGVLRTHNIIIINVTPDCNSNKPSIPQNFPTLALNKVVVFFIYFKIKFHFLKII